jgi:hypothetical protein
MRFMGLLSGMSLFLFYTFCVCNSCSTFVPTGAEFDTVCTAKLISDSHRMVGNWNCSGGNIIPVQGG